MEGVVLVVMAVVVAVLIYTLVRLGRNDYSFLANRMADKTRHDLEVLRPCPLCGTMLRRGETVHSVVFSGAAHSESIDPAKAGEYPAARTATGGGGGNGRARGSATDDYLAHMFGCRYCYPANPEHPRTCPVCSQEIPADGYVIARMFEKPGRKHVHVLGCTECRTRRR